MNLLDLKRSVFESWKGTLKKWEEKRNSDLRLRIQLQRERLEARSSQLPLLSHHHMTNPWVAVGRQKDVKLNILERPGYMLECKYLLRRV
jgi:hypothetical protein